MEKKETKTERSIELSPEYSAKVRLVSVDVGTGLDAVYPVYYSNVDNTPRLIWNSNDPHMTPELATEIGKKLTRRLKFEAKKK